MYRPSWKFVLIGAVVVASLATFATSADAWWGWRAGCWSPPCYSASYSCADPCWGGYGYYVGWRPGPVRRAVFGPYRWYGGYGGCYSGCYGGGYSACGWPTIGYEACCSNSLGTMTVDPGAAAPAAPTPAKKPAVDLPLLPSEPTAPPPDATEPAVPKPSKPDDAPGAGALPPLEKSSSFGPTPADSGLLTIGVPFDAKVFVNGLQTRSAGSRRQFVSYGLRPGFSYKYEIRVQAVRDGQVVEETQTQILKAGDRVQVAFGFNPKPKEELAYQP